MSQIPVCYYLKNDILMRKRRPPDVSADDEWTVNHQALVPRAYRPEIVTLTHETSMSGHLGVNKIYYKILNHFFRPWIKIGCFPALQILPHLSNGRKNPIRPFQKLIYNPFLHLMNLLAESLLTV